MAKSYRVTATHEHGIDFTEGEVFHEYENTERVIEDGYIYIRLLCKHGAEVWVREEFLEEA